MGQASQQAWLNEIYRSVRSTHRDYYNVTLTLLCLLVKTGNYLALCGQPGWELDQAVSSLA
jgi:hypothetical protein